MSTLVKRLIFLKSQIGLKIIKQTGIGILGIHYCETFFLLLMLQNCRLDQCFGFLVRKLV